MSLDGLSPIVKREFIEFLKQKVERTQNELKEFQQALNEAEGSEEDLPGGHLPSGNGTKAYTTIDGNGENKSTRNSIGWKYKIKEVLEQEDKLTTSDIIMRLKKADPQMNERVAKKSVGSALSVNSSKENDFFLKEIHQGITRYSYNTAFDFI